ncbi:unnamed protein product [Vitrella brassicaformis CCMP3155]|uniref:Protein DETOXIFICATION n=1 Tax=Vitrella brassicaformis (strain CCMP3155) TaxID=1169540 RepID=A0A0G4G090_VITBC|nr:unnamed protein product [Vitrella brassicaformis CCMP3155]|eukprot:CEM21276.1 unnamed protein product [Vitrella brassicaformis CCMP3155]
MTKNGLDFSKVLVLLAYAGRSGSELQSAAGLAIFLVNSFCMACGLGFARSLDTLCSQAFGAGADRMAGIQLLRGLFMLLVLLIPLAVVCVASRFFWPLFLGDGVASMVAFQYCLCLMPSLPCRCFYEAVDKFYLSKGVTHPQIWFAALSFVCMVGLIYVFESFPGHAPPCGFVCPPIAFSTASFLMAMCFVVYSLVTDRLEWTKGSLSEVLDSRGLMEICKLGGSAVVMTCLERWCWSGVVFVSGAFGNVAVAASASLLSLYSALAALPWGLSNATAVLVGNAIGDCNYRQARRLCFAALVLIFAVMSVCCGSVVLSRKPIGHILATDHHTHNTIVAHLPLLMAILLADSLYAVLRGVQDGIGRQFPSACASVCAYVGVGIPAACVFCLAWSMRLWGLFSALALAVLVKVMVFSVFLCRVDWPLEVSKALQRLSVQTRQEGGMGMGMTGDGASPKARAYRLIHDDDIVHRETDDGMGG